MTASRKRHIAVRPASAIRKGSAAISMGSAAAEVGAASGTCFLDAWIRYAEPGMPAAHQDRYFAEMARVGEALGADPVPRSRAEARRLLDATRPLLRSGARPREVARLILTRRAPHAVAEPLQALAMRASIDLLPAWVRRMHGLRSPAIGRPLVRAGTLGIARTLRWAFA